MSWLQFEARKRLVGFQILDDDGRTARVATLRFYDPERRRPRDNPL